MERILPPSMLLYYTRPETSAVAVLTLLLMVAPVSSDPPSKYSPVALLIIA